VRKKKRKESTTRGRESANNKYRTAMGERKRTAPTIGEKRHNQEKDETPSPFNILDDALFPS